MIYNKFYINTWLEQKKRLRGNPVELSISLSPYQSFHNYPYQLAYNKLFTNRVTRSVQVNTNPSLLRTDLASLVRTEKVRASYYLLTNWLAYLYGRIQSPRPDVMPDRREGITRAAGFVFACIDTQTS